MNPSLAKGRKEPASVLGFLCSLSLAAAAADVCSFYRLEQEKQAHVWKI